MDPVSIIGLVGSVVGVTDIIARSVKGLINLQAKYKTADTHVVLIMGYLQLIESALDEVSEYIEGLKEPSQHARLLGKISFAIDCFAIPLGSLSEKVEALQAHTIDDKLTVKGKLSFLLGEDDMKLMSVHLGNVVPAFNLLLSAANSKSQQQCLAILQGEETRSALKQIEDDSSSYIQNDLESASIISRRSIVSEHTELLDSTFEFDNDLFNSQVYKQAFRAIVEEQKLRRLERRPYGTGARAAAEGTGSAQPGSIKAPSKVERVGADDATHEPRPHRDDSDGSNPHSGTAEAVNVETNADVPDPTDDSLLFRDWLLSPVQPLDMGWNNTTDAEGLQQHDEAVETFDLSGATERSQSITSAAIQSTTSRPSSIYSTNTITPRSAVPNAVGTPTGETTLGSESHLSNSGQVNNDHEPKLRIMVTTCTSIETASVPSLTPEKHQPASLVGDPWVFKPAKKRGLALLSRFITTEDPGAKAAKQHSEKIDRQLRIDAQASYKRFSAKAAKKRNDEIERQLRNDRIIQLSDVKVLLLGAGASGRDAFMKTFKLKYEGSYTEDERDSYKEAIFSKTIIGACIVLDAMETLEIPLEDASLEESAQVLFMQAYQVEWETFEPHVAEAIVALREDPGFKACMARSREYWHDASDHYLIKNVERISKQHYTPTDEDIIRHYHMTSGITETTYDIDDLTFHLFNTGGYRTERKKWNHCFENASVVLFHVDISAYDLRLFEDETVNRMQDSLTLFDSIVNSRWFTETKIVLIFTKVDILVEKLSKSPLKDYCPDFEGSSPAEAIEYIRKQYLDRVQQESQVVDTYVVNLTDPESANQVLTQIVDSIKAFAITR